MNQYLNACLALAMFCAATVGRGDPLDYQKIKEIEKLSAALTGKTLPEGTLQAFVDGDITEDDIFDTLTKSDDFIDHFAKFWSDIIGVRSVQSPGALRVEGTNTTVQNLISPNTNTNFRKDQVDVAILPPDNPAATYESKRTAIAFNRAIVQNYANWVGPMRLLFFQCGAEVWIRGQFINPGAVADARSVIATGAYVDGGISLPKMNLPEYAGLTGAALHSRRVADAVRLYQDAINLNDKIAPTCDQGANTTAVTPYWDTTGKVKYRAATFLLANGRCKGDLSACFSDLSQFPYLRLVDEDATLEPGRIIGKTVADDLDFKTILTTTKTVMTGRLAYFYKNKMPADVLSKNFPGGAYTDNSSAYKTPDIDSKAMFWVERTDEHAGVLTTPAYHMITNGRRAKANRAFEAFTCSKFTVPAGAVPDPEDANPDLRQRKYCSYCHRTLEPMAAFFNRYPDTGRVNFEHDAADTIDDSGIFRGDAGAGVVDYGALLAKSVSFDQCAIRRAFEFVHGREFSAAEAKILVPKYQAVLKDSSNSLRAVIKAMVKAREFAEAQAPGGAP